MLSAPSLRGESFGMVLTEAFAAGTPVVASNIPGYRDVVRDGVDGVLVPPGDAQALAEVAPRPPRGARAAGRDGSRRGPRRAAVRVAARGGRGARGIRGRDRHPGARDGQAARGGPARTPGRGPQAARPGPPAGDAPAQDAGRATQPCGRARTPRCAGRGEPRRRRARVLRAPEDRVRQHRFSASELEPDLRPARPGDHVRRDGVARLLVVRDPEGGAAAGADPRDRRDAGHDDRGVDVLHAAGTARRAGAGAGRGAEDRSPSGELPRGARDARLADRC